VALLDQMAALAVVTLAVVDHLVAVVVAVGIPQ
jgi:hypothetical protein